MAQLLRKLSGMRALARAGRRTLLALAFAGGAALTLAGTSGSLAATTKTGHDVTCYSDSTRTHVTGYHYYCVGYSGGWGSLCCYCVWNNFPCN
jgi:hypothetical protein